MEANQKIVFEFDREQSKEFLDILRVMKKAFDSKLYNSMPGDALLSITQASELLNLAKATIYQKTAKGEIPFIKKSKRLYFQKSKLLIWLSGSKTDLK